MSVGRACGFSDTGVHGRGFSDTAGQQFDKSFEIPFHLPYHDGGGEQPSCEQGSCGQNKQLFRLGERMVRTGEQMVEEGQRLIQQGDYEEGSQLVNEGATLEQQGAALEAQAEGGMGGPPMPVGLNPGGPIDPFNPVGPTMPVGLNPGGPLDPFNPVGPTMPVGLNPGGPADPFNPICPTMPVGLNPGGPIMPVGFPGGFGGGYGCGQLSVNGNTVNTGNYTITASTANSGTLTVTDNCSGQTETFQVWGDPHITTGSGGVANFQHAPATFDLPDGTRITVDPTNNPGVNTINNVTITKGNDAVTMTGFKNGTIQTQQLRGEGYYLDATTPQGTVLTAENGNINDLMLPNGTVIGDGKNVGNIDQYANTDNAQLISQMNQSLAQLEQALGQFERRSSMSAAFAGIGSESC
jgi:Domain of Unknown Function (DUF1521)